MSEERRGEERRGEERRGEDVYDDHYYYYYTKGICYSNEGIAHTHISFVIVMRALHTYIYSYVFSLFIL